MNSTKNGTTINHDGSPISMGKPLGGTSLRDVAGGYQNIYNNVVLNGMDPKAANEANRALGGIVSVHKTQLAWLIKSDMGKDVVVKEAMRIVGLTQDAAPGLAAPSAQN